MGGKFTQLLKSMRSRSDLTHCGHSELSQEWQDYGEHPGHWVADERLVKFTQKSSHHSLNGCSHLQEAGKWNQNEKDQALPGVSNLLVSLHHTGKRIVLGHTLNTLRHITTEKSHKVLSKFTFLYWASFTAILGCLRPRATGRTPLLETGLSIGIQIQPPR